MDIFVYFWYVFYGYETCSLTLREEILSFTSTPARCFLAMNCGTQISFLNHLNRTGNFV